MKRKQAQTIIKRAIREIEALRVSIAAYTRDAEGSFIDTVLTADAELNKAVLSMQTAHDILDR